MNDSTVQLPASLGGLAGMRQLLDDKYGPPPVSPPRSLPSHDDDTVVTTQTPEDPLLRIHWHLDFAALMKEVDDTDAAGSPTEPEDDALFVRMNANSQYVASTQCCEQLRPKSVLARRSTSATTIRQEKKRLLPTMRHLSEVQMKVLLGVSNLRKWVSGRSAADARRRHHVCFDDEPLGTAPDGIAADLVDAAARLDPQLRNYDEFRRWVDTEDFDEWWKRMDHDAITPLKRTC